MAIDAHGGGRNRRAAKTGKAHPAQGATITQPPTWPQIKGVSAWLETVWWNLLAIALQHANKTPLRIELGWDKEIHFRFWISDNGSGVSEPKRMKLFQPFERLHDPEAAPGLGLSIVNRLVDLHGGACGHLESPQSGACFFFQLP